MPKTLCASPVNTNQASLSSGPRRSPSARRTLRLARLATLMASPRSRLAVFGAFVALVAVLGGSSRPDVSGLVLLRPMAILFCLYALLVVSSEQLRSVRAALLLVGSLMMLAILQLVPLPPGVWSSLPGREIVLEADTLIDLGEIWRPLSLDPDRTWNALFALFVPLGSICLVAAQGDRSQRTVLLALVGVGMLSAMLGILQAIGGGLHLYEITHAGFPVGLFANKNHQAILLLWLMLAASYLAATAEPHGPTSTARLGLALAAIAVVFPLLILTGSRAGLALCLPSVAVCAWLLLRSPATALLLQRSRWRGRLLLAGGLIVGVGLVAFVFAMLAFSTRQTALSRLFELSAADDLRSLYLPRFIEMSRDYFPTGAGLGAFQEAFNAYEPTSSLTARYMNQAHNDPVQLLIEGGLPGLAIILAGMIWLAWASWRVWTSAGRRARESAVFYGASITLWLVAGVVDYPLRTPLGAMVVACLTAQLGILSRGGRSGGGLVNAVR
jgi:O-antigen ligase